MTTQTIEVEGLPKGWKAVAYRLPKPGETCWHQNFGIYTATISLSACFIVEKIQPRMIPSGLDENALNQAGWAVVQKYVEVVGEGIGGRLFNNLKPLLRIGITEYLSLREVKETDIPLTNDEPNVKMGVIQGDCDDQKLEFSVKELRNVRSLIKDFENLGWFINPERALLLQKITEFIKDK